ncbi:MAG TPA: hypothetical protein PKE21_15100 [Flavobacteriales bacterium]|nr:hypothetical protein [Flavobacteriales bacterium]HMR28807.1 hypothetical protein [Flavobacteriales bacterium]
MDPAVRRLWLPLLGACLAFFGAWWALRVEPAAPGLRVDLEVTTTYADTYTLFWDDVTYAYDAGRMRTAEAQADAARQHLRFTLPPEVMRVQGLRIDPATAATEQLLHAVVLRGPYRTVRLGPDRIAELFAPTHQLKPFSLDTVRDAIRLVATGDDPYLSTTRDIADLTAEAMDPVRPVIRPFALAALAGALTFLLLTLLLRPRRGERMQRTDAPPRPAVPARRKLLALFIAAAAGTLAMGLANGIHFKDRAVHVEFDLVATHRDNFQVFHAAKPGAFKEGFYVNTSLSGSPRPQLVSFRMPADTAYGFLRFDPGNMQDSLLIRGLTLRCNDERTTFTSEELFDLFGTNEQVRIKERTERGLRLVFSGNDPFLYCDTDLRTRVEDLQERSGNGPLPLCIGLVTGLFALLGAWRSPALDHAARNARPTEAALAGAFVLLLWLPLLADWLPIEPYLEDTEKRPLAEKPLARMHSLQQFPAKYTKYYGDHFGYRKLLFRWNALFHTYVLRSSPMPDNVVFGKDGHLFLMRKGVVDQYRNLPIFSENELQLICERLEKRRRWLAEQGISYYLTVAPMASTIYPDKLPDKYAPLPGRTSGLDQLITALRERTGVSFIDMRAPLREARAVRDPYYTTDIHWNPWGAFVGYRTLMDRIAQDHPAVGSPCLPEDYIVEADTNDQGDLALQLAINDKLTRVTYMMVPKQDFRARDLAEEELPASAFFKYRPVFKQGPDPEAPKLLMFRDSFAVYLIPYLSEHFSRSVYVWSPVFIPDIVTREKPDIVVQELLEVFITDLSHDKVREDL